MSRFISTFLGKPGFQLTARRYNQSSYKTVIKQLVPDVLLSSLDNGLLIATETRSSPTAAVGIFYDSGPRYEHLFENGLMNFFEHIAFTSTHQRSKELLQQHLACSGALFRHNTTREMASFYFESLVEKVPAAFDILTDCLYNNS